MAEPRAEQAIFEWNPERSAKAEPGGVHESPPAATRVSVKRPQARTRVRIDSAERQLRWLTADEATVYLGLPTRKALYAAVERGQVPAHRLGRRRLRFNRSELDSLLGRAR
ncbi:MAG TPA: helix-turn-helix domain-containing protein [Armatimonadota bacterium]|jgi:excisionase family DNA binding protein